jgi:hypothetical protein
MVALVMRSPRAKALPVRRKVGWLAGAAIAFSIPLWGLSAAGFVRGMTGDLSVPSVMLLALALARSLSGRDWVAAANRQALGLSMFDPYRAGYGNLWFMAALFVLAIWAALRYSALLALGLGLAVAAWTAGWYESTNLWDYLLDPWVAVYAIGAQGRQAWERWRGRTHAQAGP